MIAGPETARSSRSAVGDRQEKEKRGWILGRCLLQDFVVGLPHWGFKGVYTYNDRVALTRVKPRPSEAEEAGSGKDVLVLRKNCAVDGCRAIRQNPA